MKRTSDPACISDHPGSIPASASTVESPADHGLRLNEMVGCPPLHRHHQSMLVVTGLGAGFNLRLIQSPCGSKTVMVLRAFPVSAYRIVTSSVKLCMRVTLGEAGRGL